MLVFEHMGAKPTGIAEDGIIGMAGSPVWLPLTGKATSQSSTGYGGSSSKAIDGNANTQWSGGSCTHTNLQNKPWWKVDLVEFHQMVAVEVTNRGDCCSDRLNPFDIYVDETKCASNLVLGAGQTKQFACFAKGKAVSIKAQQQTYLTLCEVRVKGFPVPFIPLTGKTATQSSTWGGVPASRAIDGNKAANWNQGSCTHTNQQSKPWWQVNLGATFDITTVEVTNRQDCCSDRLNPFDIYVGGKICAWNLNLGAGVTKKFPCKGAGQSVKISTNTTTYLTLCEVRVQGTPAPTPTWLNLVGKSATQSSTWGGVPASRAIDGNTNANWNGGSCTHTNNQANPWWEVNLGAKYAIKEVKVTNRQDCCSDRLNPFDIYVDDALCSSGNTQGGGTVSYKCVAMGQKVRIKVAKTTYLTLCEVGVLAAVA